MPYISITVSGLDTWQVKLTTYRSELGPTLARSVTTAAAALAQELAMVAPVGQSSGAGTPIAGDAPGHLKDSFSGQLVTAAPSRAAATVTTTQPQKLALLMSGTGIYGPRGTPIVPRTKKALYWSGAAHPVRSVRGMRIHDFVTAILAEAPEMVYQQVVADLTVLIQAQ